MKYLLNLPKSLIKEYETIYGNSDASINYLNKIIEDNCSTNDEELDSFVASLFICVALKRNESFSTEKCIKLLTSSEDINLNNISTKIELNSEEFLDSIRIFLDSSYE